MGTTMGRGSRTLLSKKLSNSRVQMSLRSDRRTRDLPNTSSSLWLRSFQRGLPLPTSRGIVRLRISIPVTFPLAGRLYLIPTLHVTLNPMTFSLLGATKFGLRIPLTLTPLCFLRFRQEKSALLFRQAWLLRRFPRRSVSCSTAISTGLIGCPFVSRRAPSL